MNHKDELFRIRDDIRTDRELFNIRGAALFYQKYANSCNDLLGRSYVAIDELRARVIELEAENILLREQLLMESDQ